MFNQITIIGRITQDLEEQETKSGINFTKSSIAVNRDFSEETDFFNFITWKHSSTYLNSYCEKGDLIMITGRLENNKFTNNKGEEKNYAQIVVEKLKLLKKSGNGIKSISNDPVDSSAIIKSEVAKEKTTEVETDVPWELDL